MNSTSFGPIVSPLVTAMSRPRGYAVGGAPMVGAQGPMAPPQVPQASLAAPLNHAVMAKGGEVRRRKKRARQPMHLTIILPIMHAGALGATGPEPKPGRAPTGALLARRR